MYKYDGISSDAFWLLAQNRFNNSKTFYDEHKEEIKRLAIIPLRQIVEALSEYMQKIDDKIYLNPAYIVSRVRRDTRFTKDKTLYRENLWITFSRYKKNWTNVPCFWFEIEPTAYSYGVGLFRTTPDMLQIYRDALIQNPNIFRKAVKSCMDIGAVLEADHYKKEKKGNIPEDLKCYYNVKHISFICVKKDMNIINSNEIIDELKIAYEACKPMYKFLMKVSEQYIIHSNNH